MVKKDQEIPPVFTCVKPSQVPTLPPRKRSTDKALAEVKNLLPDESDHFLEKDKIKDFKDFSVEVITHIFNGVELIRNSKENEVLLQSNKCLLVTSIAKFSLKKSSVQL